MKIENYKFPKSSFLSVEKDLEIITNQMLKNDRLKKLLYYTTEDALDQRELNAKQSAGLFKNNIRIVPKLEIDSEVKSYIIISFDNFMTNSKNPEFRDNFITFDIISHFDIWQLKDFQLRPYRIAAEIDAMFNDERLTGIGKLEFLNAGQLFVNENFAGISLTYSAIHGEEDKKKMLNPDDEEQFIIDFDKQYNQ